MYRSLSASASALVSRIRANHYKSGTIHRLERVNRMIRINYRGIIIGLFIGLAVMVSLYSVPGVSAAVAPETTAPGTVTVVIQDGPVTPAGTAANTVSLQGVSIYGEVMYPYNRPVRIVPYNSNRGYRSAPAYSPGYYPPGYNSPSGYRPYLTNYQTGTLTVTSDPPQAVVSIDGDTTERTPWIYTNLFTGYHTVEINYPGYEAYSNSIYVDTGANPELDAVLVPLQTYGSLTVDTTPEGADVFIDSNSEGRSPVTVGGLSTGAHRVEAHLAGYSPQVQMATVTSGQVTRITIPMTAYSASSTEGSLSVSTNVPGALVYLDGIYKGAINDGSPFSVVAVSPGSHSLLLHAPGYDDFTQDITVTVGQVTPVTANLNAASTAPQGPASATQTGSLVATSVPAGGQVYVDNQFRGVAPVTVYNLATGDHVINMNLAGYSDWSGSVSVQPGQVAQLSAQFTPGSPGAVPTTRTGLPPAVTVTAVVVTFVFVAWRSLKRE